jgi:hypothetical protein
MHGVLIEGASADDITDMLFKAIQAAHREGIRNVVVVMHPKAFLALAYGWRVMGVDINAAEPKLFGAEIEVNWDINAEDVFVGERF